MDEGREGVYMQRKRWGPLRYALQPASLADFPCIYVDAFSVAAALSRPEELFRSLAEFPGRAVLVLDASAEAHLPTARRYLEYCRRYMLDCRLAEHRPAEEEAVELACRSGGGGEVGRGGCAVLTRDADALRRRAELSCTAPVLLFRRGRLWLAH